MKTIKITIAIFALLIFTYSCSKNDDAPKIAVPLANTLTFKGKSITFIKLSIDDEAEYNTTKYTFTTSSGLSMFFYCYVLSGTRQTNEMATITYTADDESFYPLTYFPDLTIRGYADYETQGYFTNSGQVKIKRNDTGNQTFEFVNLKFNVGTDEQLLNGTINLPKS